MNLAPALLSAARGGDERAIAALLDAAQPDLRRYARRSCCTTTDVEDAVQEVLIILHRRLPTLGAIRSVPGWLFVIVHRLCLRLATAVLPFADFELLPRDSIARTGDADLRIDLARAIQSLPAHYRDVLLLRDVEELTVDEIAARLTITRETAKARLHRARKMVRDWLD